MRQSSLRIVVAAAAVVGAACADSTAPRSNGAALSDALTLALSGNNAAQSSFVGGAGPNGEGVTPHGRHHGAHDFIGGFMGGGLAAGFMGDMYGEGHGHGPFGDHNLEGSCAFSAISQRVECAGVTRHGLTITRSASFTTADGTVQQQRDMLTNTMNVRTTVSGTVVFDDEHDADDDRSTRHDTTTVQLASDRTVTGLAAGSTQRTVNGTSAGTEHSVGSDSVGHFTMVRVAGDTVTNLLVPVRSSGIAYPVGGSVVRSMQATLTYDGQSPTATTRREVITYDGSATAKLVITQDGTTRSCTLALPHGRPSCS